MTYSSISAVREERIAHSAILVLSIGLPLALAYWLQAPMEFVILICLPGVVAEAFSVVATLGKRLRRH